jgi:hypothetical protein
MNFLMVALIGMMTFSVNVRAEDETPAQKTKQGNVESMVKEAKSTRKKKVEMCHDCGKPESECSCEGEEHKKDDDHDHKKPKKS